MTGVLNSLTEIAGQYDGIVLDQWGVLHDGTAPYPQALAAIDALARTGTRLAVLSNSGKRAAPNLARIADMGFNPDAFEVVMTSGEALWRDIHAGRIDAVRFHAIERSVGDAAHWAGGLDIDLVTLDQAQAVLLMGLPDGAILSDWVPMLDQLAARALPMYCSNPDLASPRGGGALVVSPGALAQAYAVRGGQVVYYGKPHLPIFRALETAMNSTRLLMVGDSLDHDIVGAHGVGWDSLLVQGGLYASAFAHGSEDAVLSKLCADKSVLPPTYRIGTLS
ncbi:TIGR01459 family HAD-type hydrolase [Pseudooctadecabacter jejudonensis]|uniref:Putative hydrolase YutF n=1 Tax=Pseudooctadecabacter jejudonensis TaxID=1391910 RepID=A0A1Y5SIW9_9RHOB|nr:TIGR01459 family HAD-type hydrolase [Pseudooctadecabacter jejudonensis]SLN41184.1 putative hydrolase YutF [Pseudooctadecabacter jejudonensis]